MEYRNWLTDLIEHAFASKAVYEVTFKIPIKVLVQVLFSYSINLVINTAKWRMQKLSSILDLKLCKMCFEDIFISSL